MSTRVRKEFAWKTGGLDAEQLRRRLPPSTMTPTGLIKHLIHLGHVDLLRESTDGRARLDLDDFADLAEPLECKGSRVVGRTALEPMTDGPGGGRHPEASSGGPSPGTLPLVDRMDGGGLDALIEKSSRGNFDARRHRAGVTVAFVE